MNKSKELSRSFDVASGKVTVTIQDGLNRVAVHTVYLERTAPCPVCGRPLVTATGADVKGTVAQILKDADDRAAQLETALRGAGWQG